MISLAVIALSVFLATDGWDDLVATDLEPGHERGLLVAELLEKNSGSLSGAAQQIAYDAGLRALDDFELDLGLRICGQLHVRTQAPWSAFTLALGHQRAGNVDLADGLLAGMLVNAPVAERGGLWSQRGILALGAGAQSVGIGHLGHGIAFGNPDSAAILARKQLARHNLISARIGFRAALARNPEHPWALRGWGLSSLPQSAPQD